MATLDWKGLDEIYRDMQRAHEQTGPIADRMIEAGAQEVIKAWQIAIGSHGHGEPGESGRATGEMMRSVGMKWKTKAGRRVAEIYPLGTDRHGVRNAEKAFVLHYGRSNMKGDRFVDEAEEIAEANAIPVMAEIWENSR